MHYVKVDTQTDVQHIHPSCPELQIIYIYFFTKDLFINCYQFLIIKQQLHLLSIVNKKKLNLI